MVARLRQAGVKCVNFEDMGPGAEVANLVVNALYPHQLPQEHILVGPQYFCLRDEFMHLGNQDKETDPFSVLMAFGGVDEGNLSARVLEAVGSQVVEAGASIEIVLGPGYAEPNALESLAWKIGGDNIKVIQSTLRISDFMAHSGMAITSGGRTVLELAALGVPTVVICQNDRETTHSFASSENGILNLGHRKRITDEAIRDAVLKVFHDSNLRATMKRRALQLDLRGGKKRTVDAILALLK
jgi:spore coat polysaccharide biosynthesis predicted glycosyltransferase SpsG